VWQSVSAAVLVRQAYTWPMPTVEERRVLNLNVLTKARNQTPNMRFIDKVQFKSYEDKTKLSRRNRVMERLR
jgi:hypothetical protein